MGKFTARNYIKVPCEADSVSGILSFVGLCYTSWRQLHADKYSKALVTYVGPFFILNQTEYALNWSRGLYIEANNYIPASSSSLLKSIAIGSFSTMANFIAPNSGESIWVGHSKMAAGIFAWQFLARHLDRRQYQVNNIDCDSVHNNKLILKYSVLHAAALTMSMVVTREVHMHASTACGISSDGLVQNFIVKLSTKLLYDKITKPILQRYEFTQELRIP